MKRVLLLLLLFSIPFANNTFCQNTINSDVTIECEGYNIVYNNTIALDKLKFIETFKKFNFEKYRPQYSNYTMVFNYNINVILIANETLIKNGCKVEHRDTYLQPEFMIKNISYFKYNINQESIIAVYNLNK